ncbi:MAG: VTT domain-containing protein [Desulfocapsaceae bacterium]|jgi:membrane protein DedA with SNARE-associated domain|nr:VTT domain-containing protein [Desulfocapsaceae bacterium]
MVTVAWGGDAVSVSGVVAELEQYAVQSGNQLTILIAIALATLISEDLACIAAGLLAAQGIISIPGAVIASALGIYIGDVLLYLTGYLVGLVALDHPPLKWLIKAKTVEQCRVLFERRGASLIIACRFLPGTRTATFFAAGLVHMNPAKLLLYFAVAVVLWTPLLVLAAMAVGREAVRYADIYSQHAVWIFLGLLFSLYAVTRLVVPLFSWRGRRLLQSRWRRLRHWEFWPYYVTNSVTFLYALYLGCFRYRQPTLFTVVNPSMKPDSGFIGERKSSTFREMDQDALGRWQLVEAGTGEEQKRFVFDHFMDKHALDYPVVLKPDRGQRGIGVAVCFSREEAFEWLEAVEDDFIMMEFHPGEEFGVFYYRFPGEKTGKIFSINRKKHLVVVGDGHRTLEELILRDNRALCMAPTFFKRLQPDLLKIVPAGESVQLGCVGAHSLGTLFLDGNDLITEQLLVAVEKIARSYKDFYFGRFDVKTASEKDLMEGNNLKVIEINGVTSEATHIYDPGNSLLYGWKTLMEQWNIAFRIAFRNARNGHQPMSIKAFVVHWMNGGRS